MVVKRSGEVKSALLFVFCQSHIFACKGWKTSCTAPEIARHRIRMTEVSILECGLAIFITIIGLVIQCSIGIVTSRKMNQKRNMHIPLKVVFSATVLGACSATIAALVGIVMVMLSYSFPNACLTIFLLITYFFWISIWSTLVLRLHLTFVDSVYRMTKYKYYLFLTIFILLLMTSSTGVISFIPAETSDIFLQIGLVALASFFILFIIGSVLAVRYFVGNLNKLAKARVEAIRRSSITADEIQLDEVTNSKHSKLEIFSLFYSLSESFDDFCF